MSEQYSNLALIEVHCPGFASFPRYGGLMVLIPSRHFDSVSAMRYIGYIYVGGVSVVVFAKHLSRLTIVLNLKLRLFSQLSMLCCTYMLHAFILIGLFY